MVAPAVSILETLALQAKKLGFVRVGVCSVDRFERGDVALRQWLSKNYHGTMGYMAHHQQRCEPCALLPEAKSLIVVAMRYAKPAAIPSANHPQIAAYALGDDYHQVLKVRLQALATQLEHAAGREIRVRACVDSAPLLEREAAARAGVGFQAKSTLTIVPGSGSFVLLGELLTDLEIPESLPESPRCGSCTRCLVACPTKAFVAPYVLDARRCISYLTIEHRGPILRELRPLMGTWVFGCDVCQTVCPFNASKKEETVVPELRPKLEIPQLSELLMIGSARYRRLVANTALRRMPRAQASRNAAIALGNCANSTDTEGHQEAIGHLTMAARGHRSPLVRGHAAWALGQYRAVAALDTLLCREADAFVIDEITHALIDARAQKPSAS